MSSDSEWYYKDGQRVGPVSSTKLRELAKSGQLQPNDLVWRQDLNQWVQAGTVDGLFSFSPSPGVSPKVASPFMEVGNPSCASTEHWRRGL